MRSNGHTCKIIHMVTIPYISFYTVLPHTAFQFLRNESSWLCRECARAHWDWEMRMIIFDDCYGGSLMFSFVWVIASPLSTASVQWDCLSASRCCCCYCHCSRCCCTELYSTHSYSKKNKQHCYCFRWQNQVRKWNIESVSFSFTSKLLSYAIFYVPHTNIYHFFPCESDPNRKRLRMEWNMKCVTDSNFKI